jgi:hypothetical protein
LVAFLAGPLEGKIKTLSWHLMVAEGIVGAASIVRFQLYCGVAETTPAAALTLVRSVMETMAEGEDAGRLYNRTKAGSA